MQISLTVILIHFPFLHTLAPNYELHVVKYAFTVNGLKM